jgi:hypothetical protein
MDLARASGDTPALLAAISGLAMARVFSGSAEGIADLLPEAIDLAEQSGSKWYLGMTAGFGSMIVWSFDRSASEALALRAERAAQESANPNVIAGVATIQGSLLGRAGRTDEAVARYATAMARFAELGDERGVLVARSDVAHMLRRAGRLDEAEASYAETIGSWVYLGNRGAVANQLENVAYLAIEREQLGRAATLLGAAETIREVAGTPMAFDEVEEYAGFVDRVRAALPAAEFASAWAAGGALSMTDAVALATTQA